jgi:hypothetical protein
MIATRRHRGMFTRRVSLPLAYVKILRAITAVEVVLVRGWKGTPYSARSDTNLLLRMIGECRKSCELNALLWMCLFRAVPDNSVLLACA